MITSGDNLLSIPHPLSPLLPSAQKKWKVKQIMQLTQYYTVQMVGRVGTSKKPLDSKCKDLNSSSPVFSILFSSLWNAEPKCKQHILECSIKLHVQLIFETMIKSIVFQLERSGFTSSFCHLLGIWPWAI